MATMMMMMMKKTKNKNVATQQNKTFAFNFIARYNHGNKMRSPHELKAIARERALAVMKCNIFSPVYSFLCVCE